MDETPRESRGLPAVGVSIRHHLTTIVVCVYLALGAAVLYVTNMASTYTSSALVLLSPAPGNPLTPESASGSGVQLTVAMETEAGLVRTAAVRDAVTAELSRLVPSQDESLRVTVPPNTQMLEISMTSSSPEAAQDGAQGFAVGYLAYRAERAGMVQQGRIETLRQQAEETDTNLRRAIEEASGEGASSYASQEVQLFTDRLAQLNNTLSAAEAVGTEPGSVINPAELPEDDNELPAWLFVVAAAALGLIGGLGMALLREWRRDLVRASEVNELGVPVFSTVWAVGAAPASTTDRQTHEAYRRLRAGVVANGARPHVLAVTAVEEEPSSTVAASLAMVLAEAKYSVLLIATDVRSAIIEEMLTLGRQRGLAEVVRDEQVSARELLVESNGVSVLTSGLDPTNSRDLTARLAFRRIVDDLRQDFDYVLVDAATAGSADGDAALLAADSVLLVLTPDRTTRARLSAALERFQRLGIVTLGAVKVGHKRARRTRSVRSETSAPEIQETPDDLHADRSRARAHA